MTTDTKRSIILTLAFVAIFITTYKFYIIPNTLGDKGLVPTTKKQQHAVLNGLWQQYKGEYIEPATGRTIDPQYDISTSEGQSYAMLRSVWMDDRATFDMSWQWTKAQLQHSTDKVFSWRYGKKDDGSYGVLTNVGGQNTATDGDVDIALALVFASKQWKEPLYLNEAKEIINSIWEQEVVGINGQSYLVANNLEKNNPDRVLVNPSYFAPYAYRIFAEIDTSHPWMSVVDTSYAVLDKSMSQNLDKGTSANIPPDWIMIERKTGEIHAAPSSNTTTNFGYDAFRTPWRIALDKEWYEEPRATAVLVKMNFFSTEFNKDAKEVLASVYRHDGSVESSTPPRGLYGGVIGYFMNQNADEAKTLYERRLLALVDTGTKTWNTNVGYYDSNWVWFGIALYTHALPNLAK